MAGLRLDRSRRLERRLHESLAMSDDDQSPPEPDKPRRLSFREANLGPEPPVKPPVFFKTRKRSVSIGLIALGASAAAIYGITHYNSNCDQLPPEQQASCRQGSGHGGGGAHFYSGSSGSTGSSSSDSHSVSRGGFGASGSAHGGSGE